MKIVSLSENTTGTSSSNNNTLRSTNDAIVSGISFEALHLVNKTKEGFKIFAQQWIGISR